MSDKITFLQLIDRIATKTGASKQVIHDTVKELFDFSSDGLLRDRKINVSGLGIFSLKWLKTRHGRNPQTGEEIEISAHNRIIFKADAALRRFINRKYGHLKSKIIQNEGPVSAFHEENKAQKLTYGIFPKGGDEPIKTADALKEMEQITENKHEEILNKDVSAKERNNSWIWVSSIILFLALLVFLLFYVLPESVTGPQAPVVEIKENLPVKNDEIYQVAQVEESEKHIVVKSDRLWDISLDFYNDAYLWPNIFRVNTSVITDPDILNIGINIEIPYLDGKIGSLSENDLKNITEGFMQAYFAYQRLGKSNACDYLWVAKQYGVKEIWNKHLSKINPNDLKTVMNMPGTVHIK